MDITFFMVYLLFIVTLFIFTLPVQLVISLCVFVASGARIFFIQKRVGKDGKIFTLYKFRTMRNGAEKRQQELKKLNEANGPVFKIRDDPRYTKFGKFLSHTGLDELPQLFNVLKGDMALIGPRPLPVAEYKKLKPWQKKRQLILPGIISPWILNGYHRQSFNDWMKSDIEYVQKKNFWYDVLICCRTCLFLARLFFREVVYITG